MAEENKKSKKTKKTKKKKAKASTKKKASKAKVSKKAKTKEVEATDKILIDEEKQLVFSSEQELYEHFRPVIQKLEDSYFSHRNDEDIGVDDFPEFEECLPLLLEEPFEIWRDDSVIEGQSIFNYIGEFEDEENEDVDPIFYVAQVYLTNDVPSFVYLHFPTVNEDLVELYRKGQLIFDISRSGMSKGAVEGDALSEGEELAVGLYQAMLMVRSEKDIPEEAFQEFVQLREPTIEEADEIWQNTDLQGNVLVSFVREFPDVEIENFDEDLYYIVVTVEEESSQAHALLFSFPTTDRNLVDRYRHGENLQAEDVVQQSNH